MVEYWSNFRLLLLKIMNTSQLPYLFLFQDIHFLLLQIIFSLSFSLDFLFFFDHVKFCLFCVGQIGIFFCRIFSFLLPNRLICGFIFHKQKEVYFDILYHPLKVVDIFLRHPVYIIKNN